MVSISGKIENEEQRSYWKQTILSLSKTTTEAQMDEWLANDIFEQRLLNFNKQYLENEIIPNIRTCSFSRSIDITSTKKPINNAMMWDHYTNALEGFALGFDKDILEAAFQPEPSTHPNHASEKVTYRSESTLETIYAARLTNSEVYNEKLFKPLLLTKSDDWLYEQEYRLIMAPPLKDLKADKDAVTNTFTYPEETLKRIVFGSKLKIETLCEINKVLPRHVDFFIAHKSDTHYRVDIMPYNREQLNDICK
jgi:hypothetical protein